MKSALIISLLCPLFLLTAKGQEKDEPSHKLNFQVFFWEKSNFYDPSKKNVEPPLTYTFKTTDGPVDFSANQGSLSPSYGYSSNEPLIFYKKSTVNEEITYTPAITPSIAGKKGDFIILLVKEDNGKVNSNVIPVSKTVIPEGYFKFYNFSVDTLRCIVGDKKFELASGKASTFSRKQFKSDQVKFKVAKNEEDKWRVVKKGTILFKDKSRLLNIFYNLDINQGPIGMRKINLKRIIEDTQLRSEGGYAEAYRNSE